MVAYRYDGSFEGFLCCIFESYTKREVPAQIFSDEEAQVSLYPEKWIETDSGHAERVYVSLSRKISPQAREWIEVGFLSCLPERELILYRFIRMGYSYGAQVTNWLADDTVNTLNKAVFAASHEGISSFFRTKRYSRRNHYSEKPGTPPDFGTLQQPFQWRNISYL